MYSKSFETRALGPSKSTYLDRSRQLASRQRSISVASVAGRKPIPKVSKVWCWMIHMWRVCLCMVRMFMRHVRPTLLSSSDQLGCWSFFFKGGGRVTPGICKEYFKFKCLEFSIPWTNWYFVVYVMGFVSKAQVSHVSDSLPAKHDFLWTFSDFRVYSAKCSPNMVGLSELKVHFAVPYEKVGVAFCLTRHVFHLFVDRCWNTAWIIQGPSADPEDFFVLELQFQTCYIARVPKCIVLKLESVFWWLFIYFLPWDSSRLYTGIWLRLFPSIEQADLSSLMLGDSGRKAEHLWWIRVVPYLLGFRDLRV